MIELMRAGKIEFGARLERMSAFCKAERIRELLKWADGLPRRCDAEWCICHSLVHREKPPECGTGLGYLHIRELTTDLRESIHHLLRGGDSIILTSSAPAASLVQWRRALPGITLQAKSKLIQD